MAAGTDTIFARARSWVAAVMEMAYGINRQVNEVGRKLREVEVLEILDSICAKNMDKYGLVLDSNGQVLASPLRLFFCFASFIHVSIYIRIYVHIDEYIHILLHIYIYIYGYMDMYVYARDGTVEAAARADLAESHLLQIVV